MKILVILALVFSLFTANAQYSTPGTGVVWNMDSLVLYSSSTVELISSNVYRINQNLTVSANDSIFIINNNLRFATGIQVTVSDGRLFVRGGANYKILQADNTLSSYNGFRLEGIANVVFDNVIINNCGGIKVLTPNFTLQNSLIENCPTGINTSGFLQLSNGKPLILNNVFRNNEVSAISSASNAIVAPIIRGNTFEWNVSGNTNKLQINLSPSGANDTTFIEDNIITGSINNEMVGGIAISSLIGGTGNVVIRNNEITKNRNGIRVLGNGLNALIDNNEIRDNNTQNLPNDGGSGINFNGNTTSTADVSNNTITGNLWGITVQGTFNVNLGDSHVGGSNPGLNTFSENENEGQVFALFNNTPNQIFASNNCWEINEESTLLNAENVISHEVDDNSLGEVVFDPIMLCHVVGLEENEFANEFKIYPNPATDFVQISYPKNSELKSIKLVNIVGKTIYSELSTKENNLSLDVSGLNSGVYFITIELAHETISKKMIVQ